MKNPWPKLTWRDVAALEPGDKLASLQPYVWPANLERIAQQHADVARYAIVTDVIVAPNGTVELHYRTRGGTNLSTGWLPRTLLPILAEPNVSNMRDEGLTSNPNPRDTETSTPTGGTK